MRIIGQALALPGRIALALRTWRLRRKEMRVNKALRAALNTRWNSLCDNGSWGTGYLARLRGKLGASKTS